MTPESLAQAWNLIYAGKGRPVRLYLRQLPFSRTEVTTDEPTGAFAGLYINAGYYTPDITGAELKSDLNGLEGQLSRRLAAKEAA